MKRQQRKRRRQIHNAICISICAVLLLLVIVGINQLTQFVQHFIPVIDGNGDYTIGLIAGDEPVKEDDQLVICIDAGHGGKDEGSSYKKRLEKDDNLAMALLLQKYLKEQKVKVVMTREDDTFLSLSERCDVANKAKADYFVSLHRNTGEGNGIETWVYSGANDETMQMAESIDAAITAVGVQRDRGVKQGTQKSSEKDYYINSNSHMPSCIVELGFMNNVKDNQLLDEHKEAYAKAIGDALLATYASQSGSKVDDTEGQVPSTEITTTQPQDTASGNTESQQGPTSPQPLQNQMIDNVEALDATCQNWGQGVHYDEQNRPITAVSYQEKYAAYHANFIGSGDKTIYLTFDEGYEYGYTASILDTLKAKQIKAVFFVTKPYAKAQPDLVRRMIEEGHTIGNHSVTHPADGLPSQTLDKQKNEVMENHQYIHDNFGYDMNLFRFPAGKFSDQSLAIVNNCNYKSVFWSFAYNDYDVKNQPDAAASLTKLTDRLHPGAIYLLHAESETNTNILAQFIDNAQAAGYSFALFS